LSLRDEHIQRGAISDVLKHPALMFRVVYKDEHRFSRANRSSVTDPEVDGERGEGDSERTDSYDRRWTHPTMRREA